MEPTIPNSEGLGFVREAQTKTCKPIIHLRIK